MEHAITQYLSQEADSRTSNILHEFDLSLAEFYILTCFFGGHVNSMLLSELLVVQYF